MAKRRSPNDPYAEREAERYDQPIPSREFILELMAQQQGPVSARVLTGLMDLDSHGKEALRRRLKAMERDGQILRTRKGHYGLPHKMDLVRGRVHGHRDGFGFVIPTDGSSDLYLHNRQMRQVFDGDEVLVNEVGLDHRGKREAQIVEILQRNTHQLVGRFEDCGDHGLVIPENSRISHDILIPGRHFNGARSGQIVVAAIIEQPGLHRPPRGEIIEIIGEHLAPGMEIDVAIRAHEIPYQWPKDVIQEANAFRPEPDDDDKAYRHDLRALPLVTIDGEDARDFDDAVYCCAKKSGGWRLYVAIADVSHYVRTHTALDSEASKRGNSVYFPDKVVPMLPEALSNGLCSLKPEVDRLCMVCEMTISKSGQLSSYCFYEGVMHSKARLTYNQVAALLEDGIGDKSYQKHSCLDKKQAARYKSLLPHLRQLHALYQSLHKARIQRGAIEFETTETRIIFDAQRKIEAIVPVSRNEAHRLIEECMLCANVAAARFLQKLNIPALYRVHDGPSEEKLENLRSYLGEIGLDLGGGDKPEPADYLQLMEDCRDRPDQHLISTMMLRSMTQATYQAENRGHFGLAYPAYTHFTSPIRRYPDLLVHRAIRHAIRARAGSFPQCARLIKPNLTVKGKATTAPAGKHSYPYNTADMITLGEHSSLTERRADEATRDVINWLKCEFLQERVGETFRGIVSAVTSFGLFVELADIYIEGLVHISSLRNDYYHFDAAKQRLIAEHSRQSFALGDELEVLVTRVDLDDRKIDLEITADSPATGRKSRRSRAAAARPAKDGNRPAKKKPYKEQKKQNKKQIKKKGKSAG